MQKKLTISVAENVYDGLYLVIGKGKISKFVENLIRPYVVNRDLRLAYKEMAQDVQREKEAHEWIEGLIQNDFS